MVNNIFPFKLFEDADMDSGVLTSKSLKIAFLKYVCFQLAWTGTPVGTFKVQVSNDDETWIDYPNDLIQSDDGDLDDYQPNGSGDELMIEIDHLGAGFCRLVYTPGSGAGVLNVVALAKE